MCIRDSSQAEHDELASAILITTSEKLARQVKEQISEFLKVLSRREIIEKSLDHFGYILLADTMEAVAYTHLDVYKRQTLEWKSQRLWKQESL